MRRAPALLLAFLVLAGCGGSDDAKPAQEKKAKAAATPDGCATAKKTIADLPPPADNEGIADYADQAAGALETAGARDAVPILRDIELLSVEMKFKRLYAAARRLEDAGGECGEQEALAGIAPPVYAFGWEDAVKADRRYIKSLPPNPSLAQAMREDAGRMRRMVARMEALVVPEPLGDEHRRYVTLMERYGKASAKAAASGNPEARDAEIDRIGERRDAAAKRLDRALLRLLPD